MRFAEEAFGFGPATTNTRENLVTTSRENYNHNDETLVEERVVF